MPAPPTAVRLDKWLQVSRVFKTRSKATKACALSRVKVNGVTAKAHRHLALDDIHDSIAELKYYRKHLFAPHAVYSDPQR